MSQNKYRTLDFIQQGAHGLVERIETTEGVCYARKKFNLYYTYLSDQDKQKLKQRFKREVEVQSSLPNELALEVIDSQLEPTKEDNSIWFIMPLANTTFQQYIEENQDDTTTLLEALGQILEALEAVHNQDIIHRDLKPNNILLHNGRWKLSDFGIMLDLHADKRLTTTNNTHMGTIGYMSFEQYKDAKSVGKQTDVFAFGCMLFDIISTESRAPYPEQLFVDGPFGNVIRTCTQPNPNNRYSDATELREAFLRALELSTTFTTPTLNEELEGWQTELGYCTSFTNEEIFSLSALMNRSATINDEHTHQFFRSLNEHAVEMITFRDETIWYDVFACYCRWVDQEFRYNWCDDIGRCLACFFENGSTVVKREAVHSMIALARRHNRHNVMEMVMKTCGHDISNEIAIELATHINAHSQESTLIEFAETCGQTIANYHPRIFQVLEMYSNQST